MVELFEKLSSITCCSNNIMTYYIRGDQDNLYDSLDDLLRLTKRALELCEVLKDEPSESSQPERNSKCRWKLSQ